MTEPLTWVNAPSSAFIFMVPKNASTASVSNLSLIIQTGKMLDGLSRIILCITIIRQKRAYGVTNVTDGLRACTGKNIKQPGDIIMNVITTCTCRGR